LNIFFSRCQTIEIWYLTASHLLPLQVYIVRANWSSETDGALGLVHLSHAKQTDFGKQYAARSAKLLLLSFRHAYKNRYLFGTLSLGCLEFCSLNNSNSLKDKNR